MSESGLYIFTPVFSLGFGRLGPFSFGLSLHFTAGAFESWLSVC